MKARSGTPVIGIGSLTDPKQQSTERTDLSILRKPISTSITGFRETVQAYENGTDEIRNLLANECDIIYECKACRNIFRSLANFISHKRIYCRANFSTTQHFHFRHDASGVDRDVATIVQAEQDYAAKVKTTVVTSAKTPAKDLSSVIERLLRREHAARPIAVHETTESTTLHQPDQADAMAKEVVVLQLDKVKTSECAVFQTIRKETLAQPDELILSTPISISTEVTEIHNLQVENCGTLGPDGRVMHDVKPDKMTCDICQTQFDTEKTLRMHIKKYHVTSTFVYPCPACPQTFFKPWAVMQHLSNDHKKSQKRIRQMRDTIMRRRTRISEIQVKGPSRELLRLQTESRQERVTWPDNYYGIGGQAVPDVGRSKGTKSSAKGTNATTTTKHSSLCSYCGKTFDRRAALSAHLKSCPNKTSSSNNGVRTTASEADSRNAALQENDESNSNSTDSFMAMLNREKSIQAKILEQELRIASSSSTKTELSNGGASDKAPDGVSAKQEQLNKNKRKRFKALKMSMDDRPADEMGLDDRWDPNLDAHYKSTESIDEMLLHDALSRDPIKAKKTKLTVDDDLLTTDCTICDRKFANLSNLRRHVAMLHYREKKFGCTLCQFLAFRKVDVLNHLVTLHNMTGDKQDSLMYVKLIVLDKNKYSVEKDKAIADAVLRMQQKLPVDIELGGVEEHLDPELDGADIIIPLMVTEELDASMEFHEIIPMEKYVVIDEMPQTNDTLVSAPSQSGESNAKFLDPLLLNAALLEPAPVPQERQKRRGRPKGSKQIRKPITAALTPAPYVADKFDPPPKPTKTLKLMRHSSSNSSSSEEQSSRRPVRNRIKAVNKDFVYDMSDLLKSDDQRTFTPFLGRAPKRKLPGGQPAAVAHQDDGFVAPSVSPQDTQDAFLECPALVQVKGAALAMAQRSVLGNRASFNKQPEPPVERPIVPAKIIALRRSVGSDWHVMETPSPSPLNRRASNEQLLDTLTRKQQAFDKLNNDRQRSGVHDEFGPDAEPIAAEPRRSLPTDLTPLNAPHVENLLDELLKSRNANPDTPALVASLEVAVKPLSPNINNNNFAVSARHRTALADDLPRRKTLMERLAEIKTKKIQENMQKLNISSGDENH